ncbi:hypothetical protein [Actinosynnema sp. NPDC023587]|uniref:hypothetical protein n=1 Tax=Actinosynnema sp. NPDC023587 TaxID=3154695 RepID=UPI0033E59B80
MAGAIPALAATFAVTVQTGDALVFTLVPLALIDKRPSARLRTVLRYRSLVFVGNLAVALVVALMIGGIVTFRFSVEPNEVGQPLGEIGSPLEPSSSLVGGARCRHGR